MNEGEFKSKYYKVVLVISFILSVLWISFVNTQLFSDFEYYNDLAVKISQGGSWGDTYTSVGYSIILGFIYKIFGSNIMVAKIFNIILSTINNVLWLGILKRMNIKERDKKIIFILFVFFINNILFNSVVGTEILFTTFLFLVTYLYFSNIKYKYFYIGILTGINTMIKPFFIAFFLVIFIVEVLKNRNIKNPLKNSLFILIISIIVISPWIYRNTKLMGQFTYVSNNGGIVLYINNNSQNKKGRWMDAKDVENSIVKTDEYIEANMTQKNKMLSNAAKEWIKSHPKEFVELGFKRIINTYFVSDETGYSTYGSDINKNIKRSLVNFSKFIKRLIFGFTMFYILIYSIIVVISIFNKTTKLLNEYDLYFCVIFYMFTFIYFITEGQGRYAFPITFIGIYFFYKVFQSLLNLNKVGMRS